MKTESIALIAALCAATPLAAQAKREGAYPPAGYTLKWVDDFNGSALDTGKWMYRTDVKALSSQRPQNIRVENGSLVILLKKEKDRGMDYTGGGVISKERFRYGYYEARAKMYGGGAGWHQSVWAMAAGDGSTTYPPNMRTEIDTMEFDSDAPTKGHMGLIIWKDPKTNRTKTCTPGVYRNPMGFDATTGFHTYSFEWTEKNIRFFLDGDLRCVLDYTTAEGEHDALNFWLTAIGYEMRARGKGAAANMDDAGLPGRMLVDFAAFYEREQGK